MAHHHDHHAHAHDHAGHSHVPDDFGLAFAIGAIAQHRVRRRRAVLRLRRQFAGADLGRRSQPVRCRRAAAGMGRGLARGKTADRQRHTYGYRRASILAALFNAGLLLVAVGGIAVEAINRLREPAAVAGWTVVWVAALGVVDQRRDRAAVHARPPRRPQHSRRLSAHGGGCRRLARRCRRGVADHG